MVDLAIRTQDVSIRDDTSGNRAEVNADDEQTVHDQHAINQLEIIAGGTQVIEQSVTSGWQFFAENDKAFVTTFGAQFTGGTAEQAFMLLRNPVASGIYLRIKRLSLAVTTNALGTFRLYRSPTITADGVTLDIHNFRDQAVTGVVEAYSVPTYSVTNSLFEQFDLNSGGVGTINLDEELALILLEGDELLVTLEQSSNNNRYSANIAWAEETIPTP
jgi:hypothetical protein